MTEKIEQKEFFYQHLGRPSGSFSLFRRRQDLLFDKKWFKFLKFRKKFSRIPFVRFALAAGSMCLGNVNKNSDFDAIVGVKKGRIFTARYFCFLAFGSNRKKRSDKVCLSHFVTEERYRLAPPYNIYWQELYRNLVPIYGDKISLQKFFQQNDWAGSFQYREDLRHLNGSSFLKRICERLLIGRFGDAAEKVFKAIQLWKIKISSKKEIRYNPRIVISDEELEFHPDTKRIEELIEG